MNNLSQDIRPEDTDSNFEKRMANHNTIARQC